MTRKSKQQVPLGDAFSHVLEALSPHIHGLLQDVERAECSEQADRAGDDLWIALAAYDVHQQRALDFLREELIAGSISAYQSNAGRLQKVDASFWSSKMCDDRAFVFLLSTPTSLPGIDGESEDPDSLVVMKGEFETWLLKTLEISARGRPMGSGGYAKDDDVLLEEMVRRIDAGEFISRVATDVAKRAKGASPDAKKTRLLRRYRCRRRELQTQGV